MEQIQLIYGLPKETFIAIMMLYRIIKAMVGDTDFFARRYINAIFIHNLPRLCALDMDISSERK